MPCAARSAEKCKRQANGLPRGAAWPIVTVRQGIARIHTGDTLRQRPLLARHTSKVGADSEAIHAAITARARHGPSKYGERAAARVDDVDWCRLLRPGAPN